MKLTVNKPIDFEAKFLKVDAGVRYWDDAKVNGKYDTNCEDLENPGASPIIPCAEYVGDKNNILHGQNWRWRPIIDIDNGIITNWAKGITARVHYKVCDDGIYTVTDKDGNVIIEHEGYVPEIMCPTDEGYGDYIIMNIDKDGFIISWDKEFIRELIDKEIR